jgi:hypothetical protein
VTARNVTCSWRVWALVGESKMYMDLEGRFLLVPGRIIQLRVANAFGDFKNTAHRSYCFI